ncbi:MAG: hypothetical protein AAF488_19670 [Planctomycetota bacterium]
MKTTYVMIVCACLTGTAAAQPGGRAPGPGLVEPAEGERIAWYGTLAEGLAEAKRLERPVMLLSAAPRCRQVPGVW